MNSKWKFNSTWKEFLDTDVRVLFDVAAISGVIGFVLGYFVR